MRFRLFILSVFILVPAALCAIPRAAVIAVPTNFNSINAVTTDAAKKIVTVIEKQGRFQHQRLNQAEAQNLQDLLALAKEMDIEVTILVSVYQQGPLSFGELKISTEQDSLSSLNSGVRVRSNLLQNIPLLLQKEFTLMTRNVPVVFSAQEAENGYTLIHAGTYSGLANGETYTLKSGGRITVVSAGRYQSTVKGKTQDENNILELYYDTGKIESSIDRQISENIIRRYGAGYAYMKNVEPANRYLESLLIVNPFGNIILPGYGAFLSTHYMGFEGPTPSYESMGACTALYLFELLYIPAKNGFKVNFFPWIQDSDKSDSDLRTQQYLWTMIPLTFTACYLDQLSIQYVTSKVLPPGIENPVSTALHSAIVPGGGFFYKGHRALGWTYFGTEAALGFYAAASWEENSRKYALYGLGAVKIAEIIHAVLIKPEYDFYTDEKYNTTDLRVSFFTEPDAEGSPVLYAGFGTGF